MCYTDFEKFQESKKKFLSNQNQEPEVIRGFLDKISAKAPKIREDVIPASICYYIASGQPDTDRVVLPVNNFDACFGTVSFAKKNIKHLTAEHPRPRQANLWIMPIQSHAGISALKRFMVL